MAISMPSQSTKKLLERAADTYHTQLLDNDQALTYLSKRGITNEMAGYFKIGIVAEPLEGHEFQVGRLSIPYITQTGIVQMRFRAMPYDGIPGHPEPSPKYKSESGAGSTIYNARALMSTGNVAVTEGEFDCISAHVAGINAIGIPGAQSWQKVYGRVLRYRKVVILADNDDHGEGLKFAETVQHDVRGARIVLMPKGYDVNSFLMDSGPEALKALVVK